MRFSARVLSLLAVLTGLCALPLHAQEAPTRANGRSASSAPAPQSTPPPADSVRNGRTGATPSPSVSSTPYGGALDNGRDRDTTATSTATAGPRLSKAAGDGSTRLSQMGPDGDSRYDAFHPAVAYNPTADEYVVVWAGTDDAGSLAPNETEIYAVRVDAQGDVIDAPVRLSTMGTDGDPGPAAQHPAVVYHAAQNEYVIAWQGAATAREYEIYAHRVDPQLQAVGSPQRISTMGSDGDASAGGFTPAAAYHAGAEEVFVTWTGIEGGTSEIYGQRLSASGSEVGSDDIRLSDMGPPSDSTWRASHPDVAYVPPSNEYLVVWSGADDRGSLVAGEREIYARRLDASGTAVGTDDQRLSTMGTDGDAAIDAVRPSVAVSPPNNEALVTWSSNVPDGRGAFESYGQRLALDTGSEVGTDDFRFSTMGPDGDAVFSGFAPAVTATPNTEYLVTWRGDDSADGAFEIYRQQLYADRTDGDEGGPDDEPVSGLSDGGSAYGAVSTDLAHGGGNTYLAVWSGDTQNSPLVDGEHEIFGRLIQPSSPLPVELAAFNGRSSSSTAVTLRWQTASETNNAEFRVQRTQAASSTPSGWTDIGTVASQAPSGTTTEPQSYAFTDTDLPYAADTLAYRLKQIDTDGTTTYSAPLTIGRSSVTQLTLEATFPNPASHHTTVRFAVPDALAGTPVRLVLYDVMGRQVHETPVSSTAGHHQRRLSTTHLASGVYFLRLVADGQMRTHKLVVSQ